MPEKQEETVNKHGNESKTVKQKITEKPKFKCDICNCSFKREITLMKHKNTKHEKKSHASDHVIGQGEFGYVFDVIPGKENDADTMRLEWRLDNKDKTNTKTESSIDLEEENIIGHNIKNPAYGRH